MTSKEVSWPNLVSEIIDLNKADYDGWTTFMFACKGEDANPMTWGYGA